MEQEQEFIKTKEGVFKKDIGSGEKKQILKHVETLNLIEKNKNEPDSDTFGKEEPLLKQVEEKHLETNIENEILQRMQELTKRIHSLIKTSEDLRQHQKDLDMEADKFLNLLYELENKHREKFTDMPTHEFEWKEEEEILNGIKDAEGKLAIIDDSVKKIDHDLEQTHMAMDENVKALKNLQGIVGIEKPELN
jgi:hypothetical protein